MGEVWEAEQDQPRRRAALKVLRAGPSGTRARLRFRDEIDALARLQHPGIARILEAGGGEDGGRLWYAMELVPGARPLTEHARGRPWRERVGLLRAVCEAVEHGHRNGVIHRDLKPSNILVGEDGRPRVIDFGVARLSGPDDAASGRTLAGEVVGTLGAMAPEQLDGRADVRSDVYALGVVLHELLAGRPPLDLSDLGLSEALRRIREAAPPPPRAAAPELPVELDWITGRALEKDPELRYPTAGALSEELRRLLDDEPVLAGAPSRAYRLRKFVRRHRVGVALGALIVLLLVGGSAGTLAGMLRAQRQEQDAREALAEATAVTQFLVDMFERADPALDGADVRVVDALAKAEAGLSGFLSAHPRAEATLRGALGQLDFKLGRWEAAEAQLRRALELHRARGALGAEAEARELRLRHDLGQVLTELHRHAEAEVELAAVVAARRGAGGADLANALNSLALLRHRQDDLLEAERVYLEAIDVARATGDEGRVDAARVRANLSGLLLNMRRPAEAEPHAVEALEVLRAELGPDHPLAIGALNNLGGVRYQQGRPADAALLVEEAYELRSRRLPAGHRALLDTRANLATLRFALGQADEAARLMEEVLAARLLSEPPWLPELSIMLCNLVSMARPRGDDAVRDVVRRVAAAGIGAHAESGRAVSPLDNLVRFLESWGLEREALAVVEQTVAARTRLEPPVSAGRLISRACRARLLAAAGLPDEARAELLDVDALRRAVLPRCDPWRGVLDMDSARAWLRLGELDRAEPLLLEAVVILEGQGKPDVLLVVLRTLADVCDATGRAEEAAARRARHAQLGGAATPP
jgi:tetratricopeptide (TPR) repeat protein